MKPKYAYTWSECRPSGEYRHGWLEVYRITKRNVAEYLQRQAECGHTDRLAKAAEVVCSAEGADIYSADGDDSVSISFQACMSDVEPSWGSASLSFGWKPVAALRVLQTIVKATSASLSLRKPTEIVAALKAVKIRALRDKEDHLAYLGGNVAYVLSDEVDPSFTTPGAREAQKVGAA